MKRVKMTATAKGAPQGHTVKTYAEGEVHDLPNELADSFIRQKVAKDHGKAGDDEGLVTGNEALASLQSGETVIPNSIDPNSGDNGGAILENEIDPHQVAIPHALAIGHMAQAVALIVDGSIPKEPVTGEHDPHENGGLAPTPGKPGTPIDPSKAARIEDETKTTPNNGKPGKKTGK